jgi:DNA-binding transcriptional LysR family regulator
MNLRQIKYFCEVVDAGSAALAAGRLCVAPTAISMQIAQLEAHLGGALFDRSRRPMELTALGKFFHPRARELLFQARRLDEDAQGIAAGKQGWLGIGFVRSTLFSILPQAIRTFRDSFPDVKLDLVELLSEQQPEHLRNGRIHIGIGRYIGAFDQPADLIHTLLFDDPLMAALPASHPLAAQNSIRATAFDRLPFISYPKSLTSDFGQRLLTLLRNAGAAPVVAHEAIEINTALALVAAGLGGTLVGRAVSINNRSDVVFIPVDDLIDRSTMVAITRANEDSKLVRAFLNILSA